MSKVHLLFATCAHLEAQCDLLTSYNSADTGCGVNFLSQEESITFGNDFIVLTRQHQ